MMVLNSDYDLSFGVCALLDRERAKENSIHILQGRLCCLVEVQVT